MNVDDIRIIRHRHGSDLVNLSPYVVKLEWARSLTSPWQSLTVTWKATVGDSISWVMEGDWLEVYIASGIGGDSSTYNPLFALCHVDSTSGGLSVGQAGEVYTELTTATCTSWWNLLTGVNLYSVYGWTEDVGTLMSMGTWANLIGAVNDDYTLGSLAEAFKKLFKRLAAVELPATLVEGRQNVTLGDVIPIVHDRATAEKYAKGLVVESIDVGGGPPSRLAPMIGAFEATAVDILTGAFVPESMLIELFPSFEVSKDEGDPNEALPYLRRYLGGWESLVLRIKPFRTKPLKDSAEAWASYSHIEVEKALETAIKVAFPFKSEAEIRGLAKAGAQGSPPTGGDVTTAINNAASFLLDKYFNEVTWDYSKAKDIPSSVIRSFSWQRSDRARLNASSISLSVDATNGVEALAPAGLPITYDTEIRRHGLRLIKPQWTFTVPELPDTGAQGAASGSPPKTNASMSTDFVAYMRTICAQLMQFYKNNHLFMSGNITINCSEALRFSEKEGDVVFSKILDLKPGEIASVNLDKAVDTFYAYIEDVRHVFEIKEANIRSARTTVTFSRGHFGVTEDALSKDVMVPIRPAQGPPATAPAPSPQGGGVPGVGGMALSLLAQAATASTLTPTPQRAFPRDMILQPNEDLYWLRDWATKNSRGFMLRWFDSNFRPRNDMYQPEDTWKRSYVIAACAYVIERYWASAYPGAVIEVSSHGRTTLIGDESQNHTSGSAIDFSIKIPTTNPLTFSRLLQVYPQANPFAGYIKVPVLQNWACLKRLADAKKIPVGGRGLYLNMSSNGIKGTAWNQAGECSEGRAWAPPGGSATPHYDFRGTFGRIYKTSGTELKSPLEKIPIAKYVRADVNNNGSDDFDETTAPGILNRVPGLREYFYSEGINDPTLHPVDDSIPDILQVLGLSEPVVRGP